MKFRNLGSGTYTLHVKAVSADGSSSNQERTLEIVIDRPWWLSWWMLTLYVAIIIAIILIWRYGFKKFQRIKLRKHAVIDELLRQREEIKLTSEDLRQPMARMTSIISNMAERVTTVEGREQLNSLHFQMLQVITRIAEMQTTLEHPEQKAVASAKDKMELNDRGEVILSNSRHADDIDIKPIQFDQQSRKFSIVFIDTNRDFLRFINAHLHKVYDFHVYDNIKEALPDIETLNADIVVCRQDMGNSITGSELCNQFKSDPRRSHTKFVLMTDGVLSEHDMADQNITMAADDYLAKPFNVQEAVLRFNKLMGLAPISIDQNVIEGKETRMLEGQNASMTTATMSYDNDMLNGEQQSQESSDDHQSYETHESHEAYETHKTHKAHEPNKSNEPTTSLMRQYYGDNTIGDYSMNNLMDQQLMRNVEQFVLQNMSRGQISLEEMASAMGMGRVPFFHKIRSITTKTPAEVVRELRLKHACTLLINTNINMSELAINVGFLTAENFINIFKEKFGMTPLEYRLKNKR